MLVCSDVLLQARAQSGKQLPQDMLCLNWPASFLDVQPCSCLEEFDPQSTVCGWKEQAAQLKEASSAQESAHMHGTCMKIEAIFCLVLQGLDASLIGVIPYAAFRLGLYDGFKWLHKRVSPVDVPYGSH